jgi:hypothetical protein
LRSEISALTKQITLAEAQLSNNGKDLGTKVSLTVVNGLLTPFLIRFAFHTNESVTLRITTALMGLANGALAVAGGVQAKEKMVEMEMNEAQVISLKRALAFKNKQLEQRLNELSN